MVLTTQFHDLWRVLHFNRFSWDQSVCSEVQDQDLKGALKAFEDDVDPKNLAYIKFHPSSSDHHSDFAEESYRPPTELKHLKNAPLYEGKEKLYDSEEHAKAKATDQIKQTINIAGMRMALLSKLKDVKNRNKKLPAAGEMK